MIEFAEVEFGNFDHTRYKGYGARWVADRLFDSMSSVVGDRATTKAATTAGAM